MIRETAASDDSINVKLSEQQIKDVLNEFHEGTQTLFNQQPASNRSARSTPIDSLTDLIDDAIDSIKNILGELSIRIVDVIENVRSEASSSGDSKSINESVIKDSSNEDVDNRGIKYSSNEDVDNRGIKYSSNEDVDNRGIKYSSNEDVDNRGIKYSSNEDVNKSLTKYSSNEDVNKSLTKYSSNEDVNKSLTKYSSNEDVNKSLTKYSSNEDVNKSLTKYSSNEDVSKSMIKYSIPHEDVNKSVMKYSREDVNDSVITYSSNEDVNKSVIKNLSHEEVNKTVKKYSREDGNKTVKRNSHEELMKYIQQEDVNQSMIKYEYVNPKIVMKFTSEAITESFTYIWKIENFTRVKADAENGKKKMLTCNSCLWLFQETIQFSCGHSFCNTCVYIEAGNAICPLDRIRVSVTINEHEDEDCIDLNAPEEELMELELLSGVDGDSSNLNCRHDNEDQMEDDLFQYIDDGRLDTLGSSTKSDEMEGSESSRSTRCLFSSSSSSSSFRSCSSSSRALDKTTIKEENYRILEGRINSSESVFVVRLEEFSKKNENARLGSDHILFTDSFIYQGYCMCVLVCPNGIGQAWGQYLSMYFQIVEGPVDRFLKWPCTFQVRFTLRDQIDRLDQQTKDFIL
uniref:RING-type domain-containing protein n=1 Tax=Strigamia maritima TaxID=126957 RepID=T1J064_STRMM